MGYEHLRYEQDGPVTVITIDRPERMNAIGPTTARELVDAWTRFRDDDTALVGVLTGAGDDAFCAGDDLKAAYDDRPLHRGRARDVRSHVPALEHRPRRRRHLAAAAASSGRAWRWS